MRTKLQSEAPATCATHECPNKPTSLLELRSTAPKYIAWYRHCDQCAKRIDARKQVAGCTSARRPLNTRGN